MLRSLFCAIALVLAVAALAPAAAPTGLSPASFGVTKGIPVYIQEWHIWWSLPYPDASRPQGHLDTSMCSQYEPWRLGWNFNGYPMVGIYDSFTPEIIRWQARCMKAAGVTSAAIMLHADLNKGLVFIQEQHGMLKRFLDICAEEKFPVFFMDEVAFRQGPPQDPAVMTQRVINFIKTYGKHPGFFKINGAPVYYYQTYGYWKGVETNSQIMRDVQAAVGPVHWMIFGDVNQVGKIPELKSVISGSSLFRTNTQTRQLQLKDQDPAPIFAAGRKLGKLVGDLQYPKFDGSGQPWRQQSVRLYGQGGKALETTVVASMAQHPSQLMFTSWNDWEEGANFEPGWDFDGFTGDPYTYCRALAHLRGVEFVPPPYPPKEAVVPTIWEKLGYGDGAGPIIDRVRRTHVRGGSIEVVARDTVNKVTDLEVAWDGDAYWTVGQSAGEKPKGVGLTQSVGLGDSEPVISPMGEAHGSLTSGNRMTVGRASGVGGDLIFTITEAGKLGPQPAFGIAYAFDPTKPLAEVSATMHRPAPVDMIEQIGNQTDRLDVPLRSFNSPGTQDVNAWEGWSTHEAVPPCPVKLGGPDAKVNVHVPGQRVGAFSILGPPQAARTRTSADAMTSADGLRATWYIAIPTERLAQPGATFVWVRAKDAAGNWGSPRMYAVANYQELAKAEGQPAK